jgi:hypothetical protein
MCQQCADLKFDQSIHSQSELDSIINLLKGKTLKGFVKASCLFTEREVPYFHNYECSQYNFGIVNLRFNCTCCHNEYYLFADAAPSYIGYFCPQQT